MVAMIKKMQKHVPHMRYFVIHFCNNYVNFRSRTGFK